MSLDRVLVDTGPLVAILRPAVSEHLACVAQIQRLRYPLFTSWPVLTEAAWLLRDQPDGVSKLLAQVAQGLVTPLDLELRSATWVHDFLKKYRDLGAQLADGSLCYLAEREQINTIFTLDRRDFRVYRNSANSSFDLLPDA